MENWNYDSAVAFVEAIEVPISRRLTKLFLDELTFFVAQKRGYPSSEFDLLFFVQAVHVVASKPAVIASILAGEEPDEGWAAIADAWDE